MKRALDFLWPVVGLAAVAASFLLLAREFRGESVMGATFEAMRAIPLHRYLLAAASTLVAYAALAWYDQIALRHLGVRHISWLFVSACSFTTYALSHNIGASVFSGAMVRYRAYSTKGMSAAQVGILVALCSFTFFLGTILLGGVVLVSQPQQMARLEGLLPAVLTQESAARTIGGLALLFAAIYAGGSLLRLRPLKIGPFRVDYPRPAVMARQFIAAPMELIGAAGIIYFALPESDNLGFVTVLAVFLASFSAGLVSHAPGGLGVFELVFITALPGLDKHEILAALIVFRLFYLLVPLALGLLVVIIFERGRLLETIRRRAIVVSPPPAPPS